LIKIHIADVVSVHSHDAGYCAEGEKDDDYNGEGVDGCFLPVIVGINLLDVLPPPC
jgi:hypothetical protein